MRLKVLAVATAVALVASAGSAAAATPPKLTVTALGETERATQGSFCWQANRRTRLGILPTTCGDFFYPLEVDCTLPVAPGATLKVRTGAVVRVLSIALIGTVTEEGTQYLKWDRTRGGRKARKTWRFELPAEIGQAAALDISITGRRGDSNTWTGLATPACAALPRRNE
jgi:hypothetical protein